jgi:hypothetical protein
MQLADIIRLENHLENDAPLPVTQLAFLAELDPNRFEQAGRNTEHTLRDALRFERRELARLGIRFASKGGRPHKNRGTETPKT